MLPWDGAPQRAQKQQSLFVLCTEFKRAQHTVMSVIKLKLKQIFRELLKHFNKKWSCYGCTAVSFSHGMVTFTLHIHEHIDSYSAFSRLLYCQKQLMPKLLFFLVLIFCFLSVFLCGGEVAHFNAGNEGSYPLLNKQKYVGHGQRRFVTQ